MPEGNTRKIIRATREVRLNWHGEEYDVLLVPKNAMVEVDFSQFPEDDPLRRQVNIETLTKVELRDHHLSRTGEETHQLTTAGAERLLESL